MADHGSSPNAGPERRTDPVDYSQAQIRAAEGSVHALLADLRYIMGNEPADRWPELATAALKHHSPSVPQDQLTPELASLQIAARAALGGLVESAFETIKEAVVEIRRIESRL